MNDQWRGLTAAMQQPPTSNHHHDIILTLGIGQVVTVLTPPFWVWRNSDLLSGEYVGALTFTYNPHNQYHSDLHAYLGLVPLPRLLNRVGAPVIEF